MYTVDNFQTKKALREAVKEAQAGHRPPVRLYAPGLGTPETDGIEFVEGPHYPQPHSWYAQVVMENGVVVKVKA